MNKAITHGLIAGLATVIIGCFDNRCAYEETGELRFRALLELNSRGETGNTCTYPTDIPFGIWALSLPVNKTWNNHADGAQTFLEDCRVIWNGKTWITDTTHNWPPDRRVTFFAYSPYRFPATFSTERGIEFKNFNTAADSTDLMFSGPIVDGTDTLHAGLMHGGLPGADPGAIGYDHPVEKDCPGRGGFQRELPIPAGSDMERNGRHGGSGLLRRESALGRIGTTGRRNATHDATTNTGNRESDMRHRDERQHARRTRTGNRCHSGVGHRKTLQLHAENNSGHTGIHN